MTETREEAPMSCARCAELEQHLAAERERVRESEQQTGQAWLAFDAAMSSLVKVRQQLATAEARVRKLRDDLAAHQYSRVSRDWLVALLTAEADRLAAAPGKGEKGNG